ncbi:serine/threonine-protein kinase [Bacillus sp. UNCCL81]|uniref:serine/threonine-protein kinase n=1 Tax=Bacillus sp. UNCCL81 TaxID=1502755 RepID=UPI0008EDB68C|nr:serine/threonine-protein kinase [Bacillus sp. UNCCL81]SFC95899.1 Protein kinase domain-containing protein [Bacillus sp. UNCCL81]
MNIPPHTPILYETFKSLGKGGFGEVYEAKKYFSDEVVALKILHQVKMDEIGIKRFEREIKIHSQLDHKNIVPILEYDLGEIDYIPYYAMPLAKCNFVTLLAQYREDNLKPMDDEIARYFFEQLIDALEYVHANNIIHRDLNPRNILVYDNDNLKISDFGLGKFIRKEVTVLTETKVGMGNDIYTAPEQWEEENARNVDERADIYSLGKILYEMLTGSLPISINPDIISNSKYKFLIKKATQYSKERRYSSVHELRRHFDLLSNNVNNNSPQQFDEYLKYYFQTGANVYLNDILDLLISNNDYTLYTKYFMKLDTKILSVFKVHFYEKYQEVIENYFTQIEGKHTFEFTDKIALFLLNLYSIEPNNDELFEKITERLLTLAHDHKRFFIAKKLAEHVSNTKELNKVLTIIDILQTNPKEARWINIYLTKYSLPTVLKEHLSL